MNEQVELSDLELLPREKLVLLWQTHVQAVVPRGISRPLIIRAIAWALQAKQFGGYRAATRDRLARLSRGSAPSPLVPGTKLLREWQGKVYEVIVLERGLVYDGENYNSLTAIAREITGTKWSGPRFFGLKRR